HQHDPKQQPRREPVPKLTPMLFGNNPTTPRTNLANNKVRENVLEEKGKQLHVALMVIVASYSVIFFFVNIFLDQLEQAFVCLAALPGVTVTYLLYYYGYYYYSRVWNTFQISALLSLIVLYSGPGLLATVFFIPVILGILITFQGSERTTGYVLSFMVLSVMALLQFMGWDIGGKPHIPGSLAMLIEQTINVVGSSLIIMMQAVFLIRTNETIQDRIFKQAEDINSRNDQLKTAIFTRDKMMSVLSHDLRSPLALLYSGLDVLQPGKLPNDVQIKMVEQFKARTGQTLDLLDNMLLWSRLQKESISYNPTAVNLEQLYRFIESYCRLLSSGKKIHLVFNFSHREGTRVLCDRDMVEAVFRNLISNAYKFTPDEGTITLSSSSCVGGWCFEIKDSGRGMTTQEVNMINQGVSFSKEGTNREKGNGLGIQLVHDFLSQHGCKLKVTSTPEVGSSFSFSLPLV
ncbi:MAG: sensor histidine kinase, partial [Bacteroidota bacterium]